VATAVAASLARQAPKLAVEQTTKHNATHRLARERGLVSFPFEGGAFIPSNFGYAASAQ
jgi:hypothetical protein